ncbi:MAG TPA: bifunctional hydroxymethylpyrimidine kinase/phosphomethylpyrimidine kinase [Planctomycetes bacterium]|nr:bifunctional hydroxymethylpyrimidine kinase/phosphomethylpyrimidine kinase [Planctomycetota bacterium]
MKRVLIVAGSDSGGGAGIQADLKTVSALGAWGSTAVTALTAQNTLGVRGVHAVPAAFVAAQIAAVLEDIGADAVKTGMLPTADIVACVADAVAGAGPVVVDPVMVAKGGAPLLDDAAAAAVRERLLPVAALVTPNIPEAEVLSGAPVRGIEDMEAAGRAICRLGARAALVKGGHARGDIVTDVLVEGGMVTHFSHRRVETRSTHGTGCTLSAAIATLLALGRDLASAVAEARAYVRLAMVAGPAIGAGHGPLDHLAALRRDAERHAVIAALEDAFRALCALPFAQLVPEVQSNFAYALPLAEEPADVAAFPGRIARVGDGIAAVRGPAFGASRHCARIVLTAMRRDPEHRACLNIRYGKDVIACARGAGLACASFDRGAEPPDVREREGSTLEWGTDFVLAQGRGIPDAIYDAGGPGKEPMVRVLGRTPAEIVAKIRRILGAR